MSGFWRQCRIAFRCFRFGVWLLVLAALGLLLWCNRVGLPGVVKSRLVATLSERGVKLEFSKLRLSFIRGFVVENVRAGETDAPNGAMLTAGQVQLKLNYSALLHRCCQLDGLVLRNGKFILPLSTNDALTLTNLQTELRFQTNDNWSLDHFRANFAGTQITINGELAHAPEARNWKMFAGSGGDRGATLNSLKEFSDTLKRIHFVGTPLLLLKISGDARDVSSITVRLNAAAPGVRTPWFTADKLALNAIATAPVNGEQSLRLNGETILLGLGLGAGKAGDVQTHFSYEDLMLTLPDLTVIHGQTRLTGSGQLSDATKNFRAHIGGAFDVVSIRSFLVNSNAVRGFDHLTFHEPLALAVDVSGNLRTPETLNATGHIALTNAAIRGQTVDWLTAGMTYSNLTVNFSHPQLSRAGGAQVFAAEEVLLDLAGEKLFIAEGAGHIEPMVIGRAIGPKTAQAMEPYQFLTVPEARASGWIPIKQKNGEVVQDDADLRVDIVGTTPFRWRKFATPAITGTIHWWKNFLIITNAVTECYGGAAQGWGVFDVRPEAVGTDFSFFLTGTNVDFHRMGQALWSPTNRLEGALSGTVTVTRANSDDWRTWNGAGAAKLQDGLLWDVPVIGLMSPAVNAVAPGLGNSRATEAAARFGLTNGVIYTDSLVIEADSMRLQYAGTVDLETKVNAKATAQLLRNAPVVGSLFSTLLWPVSKAFECRVTGDLGNPRVTPLYVPKLLLAPLHPLRSLEEWFTPAAPATNAPAGK
jgi:hypothetical protein